MWLFAVYLLILFHDSAKSQQESAVFESYASEFFVGFVRVPHNRYHNETEISLHVTTNEPDPVTFTVTAPHGNINITAVATNNTYTVIELPSILEVASGDLTERNKGVHIKSEGHKKISVYGSSFLDISSGPYNTGDYFLALPCADLGLDVYTYYGINVTEPQSTLVNSVLIVACKDNTTVTTPSTTVTLNSLQTYWFEIQATSKITTNQPVSFFVNGYHMDDLCYNFTAYCSHFTKQQPPTAIWGDTFLIVPYFIHSINMATVIAAHDSTHLSVNCRSYLRPETYLLAEGEHLVTTSNLYHDDLCIFRSSLPILVYRANSYRITYMVLEVPVTHYSNNYQLLDHHDNDHEFYTDFVQLYVEPEYYQPERIVIEAYNLSESNEPVKRASFSGWTEVYCDQREPCGYFTKMDVSRWTKRYGSEVHVYHEDSESKLGLLAYGTGDYDGSTYAYSGGITFNARKNVSLGIQCYPSTRTLTCFIYGSVTSNADVIWKRNGITLSIDGTNYQQEHVLVNENTTENTLSILRSDTFLGNFSCAVFPHTESPAYITVSSSIYALSAEAVNVTEGGTINITCSARVPTPTIQLTWLKTNSTNSMSVVNPTWSDRVNITMLMTTTQSIEDESPQGTCGNLHAMTSRLVIRNARQSDGVAYICQTQSTDMATRNININVHPIDDCIEILCQNGGRCVDLHQDFFCDCTGTDHTGRYCEQNSGISRERPIMIISIDVEMKPRLLLPVNLTCNTTGCRGDTCSYHWYRDDVRIEGEIRPHLYMEQFSPEYRGYYTCEANNSYGFDRSDKKLVTLQGIRQYLVMVNYSQSGNNNIDDIKSQISSTLLSPEGFNNSAVGYEITEQTTTSIGSLLIIPMLLTLNVLNTSSSDHQLQQAIQLKLQTAFAASANLISVDITRFDGCPAVANEQISSSYPNITYSWPDTEIGSSVSYNCICQSILELDQNSTGSVTGRRKCGGSYATGAMWEPVNIFGECQLSNITLQLCQTSMVSGNDSEIISQTLANTTSNSAQIEAVDISVATILLESISTMAATLENENVTESFLTTIDNLILANSSEIAQSQVKSRTSSRLLDILGDFADNIQVSNETNSSIFTTVQRSYAMHVANVDTNNFIGETLMVEINNNNQQRNSNTSSIAITPGTDQNISATVTAAVRIPVTIFQDLGLNDSNMQRLSYTLITGENLFISSNKSQENLTLVSSVVTVRVNGSMDYMSKGELQQPIEVFLQVTQPNNNIDDITCGLWDPESNNSLGAWSKDDSVCKLQDMTPRDEDECSVNTVLLMAQYSQPGHFGLLLNVNFDRNMKPTVHTFALQVISYVGLPLSLICLATFVITYIGTKKLRESGHGQLLINMSISLMCLYITFLIGEHAAPVPPICGLSAALLQYFMLVFFGWTGVEAIYLYRKLVKVLGTHIPKFILKAGLIIWLVPLVFVTVLAGPLNRYYYISNEEPKPCNTTLDSDESLNSTSNRPLSGFCRADGPPFWVGTVAPFIIIYLINWIMFILIMVSVYQHAKKKLKREEKQDKIKFFKQQIIVGFGLATLFGLGWGLGLAASSTTVYGLTITFQILFSIFVAFQGVLFFVLHGIKKKEARDQWKTWLTTIIQKPLSLSGMSKSDSKSDSKATHSKYNTVTLARDSTLSQSIITDQDPDPDSDIDLDLDPVVGPNIDKKGGSEFGKKLGWEYTKETWNPHSIITAQDSKTVSQTPNPPRKISVHDQMDKQWSSVPNLDKMDDSAGGSKSGWEYNRESLESISDKSISSDLYDSDQLLITTIDQEEGNKH